MKKWLFRIATTWKSRCCAKWKMRCSLERSSTEFARNARAHLSSGYRRCHGPNSACGARRCSAPWPTKANSLASGIPVYNRLWQNSASDCRNPFLRRGSRAVPTSSLNRISLFRLRRRRFRGAPIDYRHVEHPSLPDRFRVSGRLRLAVVQARDGVTPARIIRDGGSLGFGGSRLPTVIHIYRLADPTAWACLRASHVRGQQSAARTRRLPQFAAPRPAGSADTVFVRNIGGGGRFPFSVSLVGESSWLVDVNPSQGMVGPNAPVPVRIRSPATTSIRARIARCCGLRRPPARRMCPSRCFVGGPSPAIRSLPHGFQFDLRQGAATSLVRRVEIAQQGNRIVQLVDADLVEGGRLVKLGAATGLSTPEKSSFLSFSIQNDGLAAGAYYALVRISSPEARNSPELVPIVLNVQDPSDPAAPGPFPGRTVLRRYRRPAATATPVRANRFQPLQTRALPGVRRFEDGQSWLPPALRPAWLPRRVPASILFRGITPT